MKNDPIIESSMNNRWFILRETLQDITHWAVIRQKKRFIPIILLLLGMGALIIFAQAASAPFIYALF